MSIEPQRTKAVSKLLTVISNEERMEELFHKIAHYGHHVENIRHNYLGQKKDTLCLPELLLFIAKGQDDVFTLLKVDPLSIIKEAFYYAVHVDTTQTSEKERIDLKKTMSVLVFFDFMANLFMFSRLWEIFAAADDGIEDEFISKEEFCRAKDKLESMGGVKVYREMTDAQWARGFHYIDDSNDEQIEYSEFVQFCCKFIITPEEYLIKAISVCVVKRGSIYDLSPDLMKPAMQRWNTFKKKSSIHDLETHYDNEYDDENDEDDENPAEMDMPSADEMERRAKIKNDNFDAYLREVKAAGLANNSARRNTSMGGHRQNRKHIVRTHSEGTSSHGYGDNPSPQFLERLNQDARFDKTKIAIDEWTDRRMDEWSARERQAVNNDSGDDFDLHLSSQHHEIVKGHMNLDSLDNFLLQSEQRGDDDDDISVQSVISASTLLSNVESINTGNSTTRGNGHNVSLRTNAGGSGSYIGDVNDNLSYFSRQGSLRRERSYHEYRSTSKPLSSEVFQHIMQPKSLDPVESTTHIVSYMKDRETRTSGMYDSEIISSLPCNVKRNLDRKHAAGVRARRRSTAPRLMLSGGIKNIMNNNVSFGVTKVASLDDDLSDDDDACHSYNFTTCSHTEASHATTSTPNTHNFDVDFINGTGSKYPKVANPGGVDVISLIEKMIIAQFESPRPHKDYSSIIHDNDSKEDGQSVSVCISVE